MCGGVSAGHHSHVLGGVTECYRVLFRMLLDHTYKAAMPPGWASANSVTSYLRRGPAREQGWRGGGQQTGEEGGGLQRHKGCGGEGERERVDE
jgi:hypothetical protein